MQRAWQMAFPVINDLPEGVPCKKTVQQYGICAVHFQHLLSLAASPDVRRGCQPAVVWSEDGLA